MSKLKLFIDGMHCDACVRRVGMALEKVPGVRVEQVSVGTASVDYDPASASEQQIIDAVNRIGFRANANQPA